VTTSRLFVTDRVSKRQFLVDTGSDLCVFLRKFTSGRKERVNYDVFAANGTTIPTYGWLSINLNLGLRRDFTWRFLVADIQTPSSASTCCPISASSWTAVTIACWTELRRYPRRRKPQTR
jgi:hypothetical protein